MKTDKPNSNKIEKDAKDYNKAVEIIKLIAASIVGIVIITIAFFNLFPRVIDIIEIEIQNATGISFAPYDDCVAYKPVIYVYGEKDGQKVDVNIKSDYTITCSYPEKLDGWSVLADRDGKLNIGGQEYNYIFWESENDIDWDFSKGFCVKGIESRNFLDESLDKLGLNRKEANEFIIYWLPKLEQNEYNLISFQTDLYEKHYRLDIVPNTNNVLRVFMTYKALDKPVDIEEQNLDEIREGFKREGLHVVEWGGSYIE